jgi:hypothetical protein
MFTVFRGFSSVILRMLQDSRPYLNVHSFSWFFSVILRMLQDSRPYLNVHNFSWFSSVLLRMLQDSRPYLNAMTGFSHVCSIMIDYSLNTVHCTCAVERVMKFIRNKQQSAMWNVSIFSGPDVICCRPCASPERVAVDCVSVSNLKAHLCGPVAMSLASASLPSRMLHGSLFESSPV